ncbi:MAG: TetR/AcrR family transcriptional regulator [Nakamurella sp.]
MTLSSAVPAPSIVVRPTRSTLRGTKRRAAIVAAAAELFARHGFPGVGMDDIGAAVGVTGPAIYRHFDSKAAVLTAVIDTIIDAVAPQPHEAKPVPASKADPAATLRARIAWYAAGVAARRELMAIFVREVHHLPREHAERLRLRQRGLVTEWRILLAAIHPTWDEERVRTGVHAVFGMFNAVGTFTSPLSDAELAAQLSTFAVAALQLPDSPKRHSAR